MECLKLAFAYLEGKVYFPHFVDSICSSTYLFSAKRKLSEEI